MTTSSMATASKLKSTRINLWKNPGTVTEKIVIKAKKDNVKRLTEITVPSMTFYPIKTDKPTPIVLVCPGGGYNILSIDKEGTEIAEWLNSIGITAVVLKYTVPENRKAAFRDVQRAMGIIRKNSLGLNIDKNRCGIIGFSAGAHLSVRLCNNYKKRAYKHVDDADKNSCRPNFCILIYPAYLQNISIEKDVPPTFIIQTQDDKNFIQGTIDYAKKLKDAKIQSEFHLFKEGGHGYGLRPSKNPVSNWPALCEKWLQQIK